MFKLEKDMIPVLQKSLSRQYKTEFFTTEFNTGNGIADLVFTTGLNDEPLVLEDYYLMSIFVKHFSKSKRLSMAALHAKCSDSSRLNKLFKHLEKLNYIKLEDDSFTIKRRYQPHTKNLISIEAKLKDWKSGLYQAMRYQFFSHKSFLAYPEELIHRVDKNLLEQCNVGLISVSKDGAKIIINPKSRKPEDKISYYFLSQSFAKCVKE